MGTWGLQGVGPSLCPLVLHVVPCGAGMWDPGMCPPLELGSTAATTLHCHLVLQPPTSSTGCLCCSPAMSRRKREGATGEASLGASPSPWSNHRAGSGGRGKLHSQSCRAPSARGRSGGRDSRSKQGFHHTSASSAMQPSPAHTDMQHRKALLSTPGVHGPCTGSTAAGTALLPRWLCPLCCPTGSAMGSAMSSRKQVGARLSLWQGTLWEGPWLYPCSMAAWWGWREAMWSDWH